MTKPPVTFDRETLSRLKAAYEPLKSNPDAVFTFEGREYLVSFTKYLIEHLEEEFK